MTRHTLFAWLVLAGCSKRLPDGTCPATGSDDLSAALGDTECSTITLDSGTFSGLFTFDRPVRIVGAGPENTVFDGGGVGTVLTLGGVGNTEVEGVRVVNGAALASDNTNGGGLVGYGGGALTLRNVWIEQNRAANGGAGAYVSAGYEEVLLEDVRIFDNTVEGLGVGAIGGGLWLDAPERATFRDSEITDNVVQGSTLYQAAGGGLLVSCYMGTTTPPTVTAENLVVRGNRVAPDAIAEGQAMYGGGIAIDCPGSRLDFSGTIEENSIQNGTGVKTTLSGAGLSLSTTNGQALEAALHDTTVRANTLGGDSSSPTVASGGGIAVDCGWPTPIEASALTLERSQIEGNEVLGDRDARGGGVAVTCSRLNARWTDSTFVGNRISSVDSATDLAGTSRSRAGGAAWFSSDDGITLSSSLELLGVLFAGNIASGVSDSIDGGALYLSGVDSVALEATAFSGNRAKGRFTSGAGLHANLPLQGTLTVADSTFEDNQAANTGAGEGALPSVATHAVGGGAVSLFGVPLPDSPPATVTVERTRFDANAVTGADEAPSGAHGGALLAVDVALTLRDSSFASNRVEVVAGGYGGAVALQCKQLSGASALITDRVTLIGNTASSGGGALNSSCASVHTLRETTVVDNAVTIPEGAALTSVGGGGLRFSSDDGVTFSSDDGVTLVEAQNLTLARNTLDAGVGERWGGQLYMATRDSGVRQLTLLNSTLIAADDSNLGSVLGLAAWNSSSIGVSIANTIIADGAFSEACSAASADTSTIKVSSGDRNWVSGGCYTDAPPANDIVPGAAEVGQPLGTWLETSEGVPYFLPDVGSSVLDAVGPGNCNGLDGLLTVDAIGTPRTCPLDAGSIERP